MEQNNGLRQAKSLIRRRILSQRLELNSDEAQTLSQIIQERLLGLKVYADAETIMCYMPCRQEVNTELLIRHALEAGKRVCLPVVISAPKQLLACQINHPHQELEPDAYGILSPCYPGAKVVNSNEIQLIIVPGIAFDERGYRLGYGGGYYDRFLSQPHQATTAGLAYSFQLVDKLPVATHDIKLDLVITERGILYG